MTYLLEKLKAICSVIFQNYYFAYYCRCCCCSGMHLSLLREVRKHKYLEQAGQEALVYLHAQLA